MNATDHRQPVIRVASPRDFHAAGDVTELAFAAGPYGDLPRRPERVRLERDVAPRAADGEVLVAERDGRIVGTVSVLRAGTAFARRARDDEAELRLLAVAPDQQGDGIGRLLVAGAHEVALEWGVPSLVLDTGTRNTSAQRLYRRHGFERVADGPATSVDAGSHVEHVVFRLGLQPDDGLVVRLARPDEYDEVAALSLRAYEGLRDLGRVPRLDPRGRRAGRRASGMGGRGRRFGCVARFCRDAPAWPHHLPAGAGGRARLPAPRRRSRGTGEGCRRATDPPCD